LSIKWLYIEEAAPKKRVGFTKTREIRSFKKGLHKFRFKQENEARNTAIRAEEERV
jgi:hypothetical protein